MSTENSEPSTSDLVKKALSLQSEVLISVTRLVKRIDTLEKLYLILDNRISDIETAVLAITVATGTQDVVAEDLKKRKGTVN
jgi:hypothetical protein